MPGEPFPSTRPSILDAARSEDAAVRALAWDELVSAYWKPVYKHLRLHWRADAQLAEDLTQGFFAKALEKEFFAGFDAQRARFRTFLRVCVDGWASKQREAERREKRGGGRVLLRLDFAAAESELSGIVPEARDDLDDHFHREWIRGLFEHGVRELRELCERTGRRPQFAAFVRYDLEATERGERLSYADLAQELGVPVTSVTNWLHWTRGKLRELLLARLRRVSSSEDEYRAEARALLGGNGP